MGILTDIHKCKLFEFARVRKLVNKQNINPHIHPDTAALPAMDDCESLFFNINIYQNEINTRILGS